MYLFLLKMYAEHCTIVIIIITNVEQKNDFARSQRYKNVIHDS